MARRQWFERFFDADYVALLRDTNPPRQTGRAAGHPRVKRKTVRFQEFSLRQWRRMFREVGLRFVKAYSGYDGRPYRPISKRRLIVVGARER
jgi:hypothetical protein